MNRVRADDCRYIDEFLIVYQEDVIAVWKCYIDESGTDDGQLFTTTGVAIAQHETWERFLPCWRAVLDEYGLANYHAADFNNYKNCPDYSHLSEHEQKECSKKLIGCLDKAQMQGFGFGVRVSEFSLALQKYPIPKMRAIDMLLERSVCKIQEWGDDQPTSESIGIAIEMGQKIHSDLLTMLREAAAVGGLGKVNHIGFYRKEQCAALQVADMIAYEGFKYLTNIVKRPDLGERKSFTAMRTAIPIATHMYHSIDTEMWLRNTRKILQDEFGYQGNQGGR